MFALGRPYRGRLSCAVLLAVFAVAATLSVPLGLQELVDTVLRDSDRQLLDWLAIGLLALLAARAAASFLGGYLLRWVGERVVADLRTRMYAHLHTLDLSYFGGQRIGDLTSRLTSDVAAVRTAVTDALVSSLIQVLKLAGSVALMVVLNWRLGVLVLAVVPIATLASRVFGGRLRRLARQVQDRLGYATAVAEEALSAVRVVQAFGREPHEVRRYRAAVEVLFDAARRKVFVSALFSATVDLLFLTATVAIFWYGGVEVLAGRLTAGELIAFLFYALNVSQSVGELTQLYATFSTAVGASGRLFELLDTRAGIADAQDARPLSLVAGAVRFDHVRFGYERGHPVLRDVTLTVEPGETVAIVGPSGAGKTTLLNLIPRFFDPTRGRVLIDEQDVRLVQLRSLREQIAIVSQDVLLFGGSVRENIRYGRVDATDDEIEAAARAANAHDFIVALPHGYDTNVGECGGRLSGGERQRIAIARALLRDARLLLLDEATSAVDAASEALIQQALERLTHGRTTFVVAHRLTTIRNADRIVVVDGGALVESGTHDELMANGGLYARLVAYQYRARTPGARRAKPRAPITSGPDGGAGGPRVSLVGASDQNSLPVRSRKQARGVSGLTRGDVE